MFTGTKRHLDVCVWLLFKVGGALTCQLSLPANSCKLTKLASISTYCTFYPNTVGLTSDSKKVPKNHSSGYIPKFRLQNVATMTMFYMQFINKNPSNTETSCLAD